MIRAIVVDDEHHAVDTICTLVNEYVEGVEIVGKAHSALEGIKAINAQKPDVVFLDIEMPNGNGFDLLESIPDRNFHLIFTTAYNEYAIRAFKFSAFDYILKPIGIDEFVQSMERLKESVASGIPVGVQDDMLKENYFSDKPQMIGLGTKEGIRFVQVDEIMRIEGDGGYSKFYMEEKEEILVSRNLKEFQDLLFDYGFFRTHQSHLVNLKFVKEFIKTSGGAIRMVDGAFVDLARNKKGLFLDAMQRRVS